MGAPKEKIVKRLFAVSGNRCAFPNCSTPLVDPISGKVTAKICHIKARNPGGPRYDAGQTEDDRHGFDNLLLMCPVHHDVIDSDVVSYTVDRLHQIKSEHEAAHQRGIEASDEVVLQLINNIADTSIVNGSLIVNQNQMGGQVAHSITNVGPQPRRITIAAANALITDLRQYPAEDYDLSALMGDSETDQLARILRSILHKANWTCSRGLMQGGFNSVPRGVQIWAPEEKPSLEVLKNWLEAVNLNPTYRIMSGLDKPEIVVGANPEFSS